MCTLLGGKIYFFLITNLYVCMYKTTYCCKGLLVFGEVQHMHAGW